jgi:hypothetical protein
MKRLLIVSLLLTGCGYLPQINPLPTVTVTATVTATPEAKSTPAPTSTTEAVDKAAKQQNQISKSVVAANTPKASPTKPSNDFYEIRFEGKAGTKATGIYSAKTFPSTDEPSKIEKKEGILPFTVKLELPSNSFVVAQLGAYEENANPKVFILKNGKECGKVLVTGSAIPNPESSKVCSSEDVTP